MRHTYRRALPAIIAAGLLLAACGSSSSTKSTGTTTPAAATATGAAVTITTKHASLGTVLAFGPKKLTAYLWEADKGTTSSCSGACAGVWSPVTGTATATGGAVASKLGTTTRADGTTQVTYNGHPLYGYQADKDVSDAYGQGSTSFGAAWYALTPNGDKLDKS